MNDVRVPEDIEKELELEIIRSFGSALIEFEEVLFQKVLITSARMLITREMFSKKLEEMTELGYVVPMTFHGMKCWKKLVDEEEIEMRMLQPDEIHSILERGHSMVMMKNDRPSSSDSLVTETRYLAKDILHMIRVKLFKGNEEDIETRKKLFNYFRDMRRALAESEGKFMDYIQSELPLLYEQFEIMLRAKGADRLLPALRIVELGLIDEAQ